MSTTNLHAITKKGDFEIYARVNNSWLGGMRVWNVLNERYEFYENMFDQYKRTWGSFRKGIYQNFEDITLGSTFDRVYVKKEDFEELCKAFKEFESFHGGTNLVEQAEIIEKMSTDDNVVGVAWCQTSVCDDMWDYEYDEDNDKVIPYNMHKGEKHWDLFSRFEK